MAEKSYPKDYFKLVQDNERLLDAPLKTKQLTYFQDAMLRFGKNKYNVIASIVLLIIILMSIFAPMLIEDDRYNTTHSAVKTIPPRVPILEKFGILDGTQEKTKQPIDPATLTLIETGESVDVYSIDFENFDPTLYSGYPTLLVNDQVNSDYIFADTLKLDVTVGSTSSKLFVGGTNDLFIDAGRSAYSIMSSDFATIEADSQITIDINELDQGTLEVYFAPESMFEEIEYVEQETGFHYTLFELKDEFMDWTLFTELGETSQAGISVIDPTTNLLAGEKGRILFRFNLNSSEGDGQAYISFNSINFENITVSSFDEKGVAVTLDGREYFGYNLSTFQLVSFDSKLENGRYSRVNAHMITSSFRYDTYSALFADRTETLSNSEYQLILDDNPGMADAINQDTVTEKTWEFDGDFPITAVTNVEAYNIAGRTYANYTVLIDGATSLGYETIPYFLFGTDVFGKDLFALIWLGLRTSLMLGLFASITNIFLGVIWGAISAYYGGQVDILMERFSDIWGSFPQITMIGIINALIGPGFLALYIFLVYDGWIGVSKVTRMQFYRYKGREYVLAARTLGASDMRIIFKHILPNALGTIVTRVVLNIPSVIFLEVNLSYLGFGIGNGATLKIFGVELTGTSIGVILSDGREQMFSGNLWLIIYPTIVVSVLMICFNMFGNALRDALNPQLRGSE